MNGAFLLLGVGTGTRWKYIGTTRTRTYTKNEDDAHINYLKL